MHRRLPTRLWFAARLLEAAGYHAQVTPSENSFPLFMHDETGARHAVTRNSEGKYTAKNSDQEYSEAELAELALSASGAVQSQCNFACRDPGLTCCPQLPITVAPRRLPTLHKLPKSIVWWKGHDANFAALKFDDDRAAHGSGPRGLWSRSGLSFVGQESLLARVVEEHLGTETAKKFGESETLINGELDQLREQLRGIDPTLADALETGRRKINHQLEGLRSRFHRAQMQRDEAAQRQLQRAFEQLYPEKALQERHINVTSLLARHGRYVIDWIYNAIPALRGPRRRHRVARTVPHGPVRPPRSVGRATT